MSGNEDLASEFLVYNYIKVIDNRFGRSELLKYDGAGDRTAYLNKAMTLDRNFEFKGEFEVNVAESGAGILGLAFTTQSGSYYDVVMAGGDVVRMVVYDSGGLVTNLAYVGGGGAALDAGGDISVSLDTTYYFILKRDTYFNYTLEVYSDMYFQNLVGTSELIHGQNYDLDFTFTYIMGIDSGGYSGGPAARCKGELRKLRRVLRDPGVRVKGAFVSAQGSEVLPGDIFSLNPTITDGVVDDSTELMGWSAQDSVFYAAGLYWCFYVDDPNFEYRTSEDGVTWSSPTVIRSLNDNKDFSVDYAGSYVHYAVTPGNLYYRRGEPQSDGSITWSAVEQEAQTGSLSRPDISAGDTGQVAIIYYDGDLWAIRNGNVDGTWSTSDTHRLSFSDTWGTITRTDANNLFVAWTTPFDDLYAEYYTGSWNSDALSEDAEDYNIDVAVHNGTPDYFCLAWLDEGDDEIKFKRKTCCAYDQWGSTVAVGPSGNFANPSIVVDGAGAYWIFYYANMAEEIRYYRSTDGGSTWNGPTTVVSADLDFFLQPGISAFYNDGKICLAWSEDNVGIKFAVIAPVP